MVQVFPINLPDYIGDISVADARVLNMLTDGKKSILEFGCGASTQVIAYALQEKQDRWVRLHNQDVVFTTVDTSEEWIQKTIKNLRRIGIRSEMSPLFQDYEGFETGYKDNMYDLIFVDGEDSLRVPFAEMVWPYLEVGGTIAFHDTRREADMRNVLEFIAKHQHEIGEVQFNGHSSNITYLRRKIYEPYDNWQISENRLPWQLGYGNPPENQ